MVSVYELASTVDAEICNVSPIWWVSGLHPKSAPFVPSAELFGQRCNPQSCGWPSDAKLAKSTSSGALSLVKVAKPQIV